MKRFYFLNISLITILLICFFAGSACTNNLPEEQKREETLMEKETSDNDDVTGETGKAPEDSVPSVDATEVEKGESSFHEGDDEPAPRPKHPPIDQIPPMPMPMPEDTDEPPLSGKGGGGKGGGKGTPGTR